MAKELVRKVIKAKFGIDSITEWVSLLSSI
jgi:hypothetical protein